MIAVKDLPPAPDAVRPRRALLSVFDKTGLVNFARGLARHGVALVSTGGTAAALRAAGLDVDEVGELTGYPEVLGGRVKTLHPAVHGGILYQRNDAGDAATVEANGMVPIDLVVVNLYPFAEAVATPDVTDALAAENVDIGGPAMLRAAAKNFAHVAAVSDPSEYAAVLDALNASSGTLPLALRRALAGRTFARTSAYDAAIAAYFARPALDDADSGAASKDGSELSADEALAALAAPAGATVQPLRYGENPHQRAAYVAASEAPRFRVHSGKALSYNNLLDLDAALDLAADFADEAPTVAIFKHTNPCGVATRATLDEAYAAAFATDREAPFGGIVVVNRPLTRAAAEHIDHVFTELVIAPAFEDGVLEFLSAKANRRVIEAALAPPAGLRVRSAAGGWLVQDADAATSPRESWQVVTERAPTDAEWRDLVFAWRVARHVKSNAIVYARGEATLGVGAGQMSRVNSAQIAAQKAAEAGLDLAGAVVASDAFFPFADGLEAAAAHGITAAIQPGGSMRDAEVIDAANRRGLAMVTTGRRHFRH